MIGQNIFQSGAAPPAQTDSPTPEQASATAPAEMGSPKSMHMAPEAKL